MKRSLVLSIVLVLLISTFQLAAGRSPSGEVFQVSTFGTFAKGAYEGFTTFSELKRRGDFGIGTINGLDGEMIARDGEFFLIRADGKVSKIDDSEKAPFAMVTFFKPDNRVSLSEFKNIGSLQDFVDSSLPGLGNVYAVRIDGDFSYLKVRSVPLQQKPYPPLEQVIKNQTVFELRDIQGTMVGFRFPSSLAGVNVPGYHFHFISKDGSSGGHVLDCVLKSGQAGTAVTSDLVLRLR